MAATVYNLANICAMFCQVFCRWFGLWCIPIAISILVSWPTPFEKFRNKNGMICLLAIGCHSTGRIHLAISVPSSCNTQFTCMLAPLWWSSYRLSSQAIYLKCHWPMIWKTFCIWSIEIPKSKKLVKICMLSSQSSLIFIRTQNSWVRSITWRTSKASVRYLFFHL